MATPNSPSRGPLSRAVHFVALDDSTQAPVWVELTPPGEFFGRDGRGPYRSDVESILDAFHAMGMPLPIDYEHQSSQATKNGQPAPAAGWVHELQSREGGAIWGRVEWTARGGKMVADHEYRYLSPEFMHLQDGTVVALASAGLTNKPNLYLTALNRQADGDGASTSTHMRKAMDELIERLRYMLNLPVTSTPEEIAGHLQRLMDQLQAPATAAMRQQLGLAANAGLAELITAAHGRLGAEPDPARYVRRAEHDAVAGELAAMKLERAEHAVQQAVEGAMREGRLLPTQKDWAVAYCRQDPAGFGKWREAAPVVAPLGEVATHARAAGPNGDGITSQQFPGADPERLAQHQSIQAYAATHKVDYATAALAVMTQQH